MGELELDEELSGRFRRPPWLFALSAPAWLNPSNVDWSFWSAAKIETTYYHPSLHKGFFVLPAELQRMFRARPPPSLPPATAVQGSSPPSPADIPLLYSFTIDAHNCDAVLLNDTSGAAMLLEDMAKFAGLTVV